MGQLDLLLGPMLIGTTVSVFLSGVMLVQCYNYFIRFPKDQTWMKVMVAYLLVADFAHSALETAITYQYTVTFFGDLKAIVYATPLFACIPVLSVAISTVAQGFFAWRIARLTRLPILGWLIGLLAVVQFLCGVGVTIAVTRVTSFFMFGKFEAVVIPWLTSSVLCDVIITFVLCWYLQTNRSGIPATDDLVTKIIRATIQTGLVTSLWAVLDLIIYRVEVNSLHLIFNFPLAKVYTNSLMSTLNARRAHSDALRGQAGARSIFMSDHVDTIESWGAVKMPSRMKVTSRVVDVTPLANADESITTNSPQTPNDSRLSIAKYYPNVISKSQTHDIPLSTNTDPHTQTRNDSLDQDFKSDQEPIDEKPAPPRPKRHTLTNLNFDTGAAEQGEDIELESRPSKAHTLPEKKSYFSV